MVMYKPVVFCNDLQKCLLKLVWPAIWQKKLVCDLLSETFAHNCIDHRFHLET